MQWKHPSSPVLKKAKFVSSAVFWGGKRHCIYRMSSIEPHYQWRVLCKLPKLTNDQKNWCQGSSFIWTMLQHTSLCFQWRLGVDLSLKWLVTISNLLIWLHLKKTWQNIHFVGNWYRRDDDVISAIDDFFPQQDESALTNVIHTMKHRWNRCVQPQLR